LAQRPSPPGKSASFAHDLKGRLPYCFTLTTPAPCCISALVVWRCSGRPRWRDYNELYRAGGAQPRNVRKLLHHLAGALVASTSARLYRAFCPLLCHTRNLLHHRLCCAGRADHAAPYGQQCIDPAEHGASVGGSLTEI